MKEKRGEYHEKTMPRRREYSYFPVVTYTTVAGTASPTIEWVDGIPAQSP
jgi:hypothetical protein